MLWRPWGNLPARHRKSHRALLELIRIDHALVDCILVDSEQRLPLIRPWVTIAIDVYTRVVLGFYLSLSYPSAMSVALCISHSILPKERWLRMYGLTDGEGRPGMGKTILFKRVESDMAILRKRHTLVTQMDFGFCCGVCVESYRPCSGFHSCVGVFGLRDHSAAWHTSRYPADACAGAKGVSGQSDQVGGKP
jgi:hypothetical protein